MTKQTLSRIVRYNGQATAVRKIWAEIERLHGEVNRLHKENEANRAHVKRLQKKWWDTFSAIGRE